MTSPWLAFGAAFAAFLAAHAIPARPPVRRRLVAVLGERGYLVAYVTVSLVLLAALIASAGRAPYVPLWNFAPWQLWVPFIALPVVCLLTAFGAAAVNPLSFGGRRPERFDPRAPGIAGVTRHPLLWALALWSAAHLVPNGDLAHVLLFGAFTVFALAGMAIIDRRLRKRFGAEAWSRLAERTSLIPFVALLDGRYRPRRLPDPIRLLVAAGGFLLLLALHEPVIGVSPLPLALR